MPAVRGSCAGTCRRRDPSPAAPNNRRQAWKQTSASLEEITAAVRQTADNARQASQLASGSRESAETGQEVVTHAITAMEEINVASAKVSRHHFDHRRNRLPNESAGCQRRGRSRPRRRRRSRLCRGRHGGRSLAQRSAAPPRKSRADPGFPARRWIRARNWSIDPVKPCEASSVRSSG